MPGSWRFLTHGHNVLRPGMGQRDMLARMALFLPRIVLLLPRGIFRAADGPLRHSQPFSDLPSRDLAVLSNDGQYAIDSLGGHPNVETLIAKAFKEDG